MPYTPTTTVAMGSTWDVHISIDEKYKDMYSNGLDSLYPATSGSIGFDLRAGMDSEFIEVYPGHRVKVHSGIHIQPKQPGIAGFIYSRSGLGATKGLVVAQGVAVIDPDYTGELILYLLNNSTNPLVIHRGDRVAQLVFQKIELPMLHLVDSLDDTERGDGGFGSTGI